MSENVDIDDFGDFDEDNESHTPKLSYEKTNVTEDISDKNESDSVYKYTQWSEIKKGSFVATGKVQQKLPPGLYDIRSLNDGTIVFNMVDIETDGYIMLRDSLSEKIIEEINKFWTVESLFKKYGFVHSRGYLLYGPPGSGKSILVKQIVNGIINDGGLAVLYDTNPSLISSALKLYRGIEPNRPILTILEDIDALIERFGESEILSFLDGETKINNVLNIATTNYPERLDKRIVSRPRRFDRVEKIGTPNEHMRREFFKKKANIQDEIELENWVNSTKDFSFAALSDLIISIKCFKYEFDEAIEKLRLLLNRTPSSTDFNKHVGFNTDN